MPKYTFECVDCEVRFDRTLKMGENPTHMCPACKEEAPRVWEGFGFGFTSNPNAPVGNTGVHKEDYPTADHAVGRSAASRWAQYNERNKVKAEVRAKSGVNQLIRTEGDGYVEYEAMSDAGIKANKKTREVIRSLAPEEKK